MTTIHLTDAQRDTFAACGLIVIDGEPDPDYLIALGRWKWIEGNGLPLEPRPVPRYVAPEGWRTLTEPCDTCGGEVLLSGKFGVDPLGLKVCPDCAGGRRVVTLTATCRWCKAKAINHPHKEAGHEGVVTLGRFTIPALLPWHEDPDDEPDPVALIEVWPDGSAFYWPEGAVEDGDGVPCGRLDPLPQPGQFVARPEPIPTQQGETP